MPLYLYSLSVRYDPNKGSFQPISSVGEDSEIEYASVYGNKMLWWDPVLFLLGRRGSTGSGAAASSWWVVGCLCSLQSHVLSFCWHLTPLQTCLRWHFFSQRLHVRVSSSSFKFSMQWLHLNPEGRHDFRSSSIREDLHLVFCCCTLDRYTFLLCVLQSWHFRALSGGIATLQQGL